MRTSPNGIAFIENQEGFSAVLYDDNGHPAIGVGHDIQPGETFTPPITREQAEQILSADLATRFEPCVNALISDTCTQGQFDALCSFAYNLGCESLSVLLGHGFDQVPTQLPRWCHIVQNGVSVVSEALVARRQAEVILFQQA